MQAQYPVKVQAIRSKGRTDRFYVFVPLALAAAIALEAGEQVQWSITDRLTLSVQRLSPPTKGMDRKVVRKGERNGATKKKRTPKR